MAIITISRGSYSRGKEVAERVAEKLGYECISRDFIIEGCKEFNVPEMKLIRAIHDAPSIVERFSGGKKRFVAYMRAVLLERFQEDNVVYHGLAGHFFVGGVSHVLKVRIIAEMEDRAKLEMEREGISRREALRILENDDEERRKWSNYLFGIDTCDISLYDIVLRIKKLSSDNAADLICQTVALKPFHTTPESQQAMDDLAVAARVKAALVDLKPDVVVSSKKGVVRIRIKHSQVGEEARLRGLAEDISGVKDVEIRAKDIRLSH